MVNAQARQEMAGIEESHLRMVAEVRESMREIHEILKKILSEIRQQS